MSKNTRFSRDPYAFSLGGLTTVASFALAPAIAGDRLHRVAGDAKRRRPGLRPGRQADAALISGDHALCGPSCCTPAGQ